MAGGVGCVQWSLGNQDSRAIRTFFPKYSPEFPIIIIIIVESY